MNDLVKRLRDAAKMSEALAVLLPHSEGNATAKLYNEAADAIEELSGYVQEAERDRDEYKERLDKTNDLMQKQWIPVTERLPERGERVLISNGSGFICESYLSERKHWMWHRCCMDYFRPTHWMPLPEPPEEETIS